MSSIQKDIHTSAEWIARALTNSGYRADFSSQSLREIDRFFDEQTKDGKANPHGLLSEGLGQRIFAIGSYIGEVVRRQLGGEWTAREDDPDAEINVGLHLAKGTICWPVQRAMKRFKNGSEDGIAAWGTGLGLDIGPWRTPAGNSGKPRG